MSPSDWSSVCGLIGTILLAIMPLRVEWFRFRANRLEQAIPSSPLLAELVKKSKEARESIIVAKWTIWDSICVFVGVILLMVSYIIPLA